MRRASLPLVAALFTFGTALTACSGSDDATVAHSRPIAENDAVKAIAHSLDGVVSVHTLTELVAIIEDASSTIVRSETWADLGSGRAITRVTEPEAPASDTFVVTEETVVVDDSGYRRSGDSAWADADADIESMVLTGIDHTGDDFATSLTQFAQSESASWTVTNPEDGTATYRRTGDVHDENVIVVVGEDGLLLSISLEQRPAGVESSDPRRFRMTIAFDDLGATNVEIPSELLPN